MKPQISTLYALAHQLLYLGMDGRPIYSDDFTSLNREVYELANRLYFRHGDSFEEEASLCLSLLMAYNAVIYDNGDKQDRIQHILDRSWAVLNHLPASLLKCRLLVTCYGEVFDEDLATEAHAIMDSWTGKELSEEEQELIDSLRNLEENPYPWSEVED